MYDITLRQIELFLTVAELRVLTKAAEVMYLSQPTVSKWIAHLESELGLKLFYRKHGGVTLTSDGLALYTRWRPLYSALLSSVEELDASTH